MWTPGVVDVRVTIKVDSECIICYTLSKGSFGFQDDTELYCIFGHNHIV